MVTKDGATVQTASAEFRVHTDGTLLPREIPSAVGAEQQDSNGVVRTSTFSGLSQPLSSVMEIKELIELNYLEVSRKPRV